MSRAVLFLFAPLAWALSGCQSDETQDLDDVTIGDVAQADATDVAAADALQPDVSSDASASDASVDATEPDTGSDGCGGEFGCPCTQNIDCASGWCIDGGEGYLCTSWCIEECPAGWKCRVLAQSGGDVASVCVPVIERPCSPCIVDTTCAGGACVTVEGEGRCAYGCATNDDCEPGFQCAADPGGKKPGTFCVPMTGSCTCRLGVDGGLRPCESANDLGVCRSVETCHPESGWGNCAATPATSETCDGLDNDCDGLMDELVAVGEPCQNAADGFGSCPGTTVCLGSGGVACAGPYPSAEICDGLDNNCDGKTDESFVDAAGQYTTDTNCGACGFDCTGKILHGVGECVGPPSAPSATCRVKQCDPDYILLGEFQCGLAPDLSCLACAGNADCLGGTCTSLGGESVCAGPCATSADCQPSYECVDLPGSVKGCAPTAGTCSCTAATDGVARLCVEENASGTCYGAETCDPAAGWGGCTAATPASEICDGLDNDCNGAVDDGLAIGASCEITAAGVGACPGKLVCLGGAGVVCTGTAPAAETCDYLDNDCDGQADEGFVNAKGKPAVTASCGTCGNDCSGAIAHGTGACGGTDDAPVCVVGECDSGYIKTSAFTCELPMPVSCLPCTNDGDCLGGTCTSVDGHDVCLAACEAGGAACGSGYACKDVAGTSLCMPDGGSCTCSVNNVGATRSCLVSNPYGACFGVETCSAGGWNGCSASLPSPEVCNGVDDDCDFVIDEAVVPPSDACTATSEFGTCSGAWLCSVGWSCTAQPPMEDVCDYKDNDCDGLVDEGFRLGGTGAYADYNNCGACGLSCDGAIPNAATTTCNANGGSPRCEALTCAPGLFLANPLACVLPAVDQHCGFCQTDSDCPNPGDTCATIDGQLRCARDCSATNVYETPEGVCPAGWTCLDLGAGVKQCEPVSGSCTCLTSDAGTSRVCTRDSAFGTCLGIETCDPMQGWTGCSAGEPGAELCNGGDDDCNYLIDDVAGRGTTCDITSDAGTCLGVLDCRAGNVDLACIGQTPSTETCNQFDDDCDGLIDEGYVNPVNGAYDSPSACGNCYTNCTQIFSKPQGYGACDTSGAPTCKLACCKVGSTALGCDGNFDHYDLNGVPDDGCEFKLDTAAIYVSVTDPTANDVAGCGRGPSQAGGGYFPCRSIAKGVSEAVVAGRTKVIVAAGLYLENVVVVSGVSLLGGYRADNWQRSVATTGSTIRGLNDGTGNAKAVTAQNITKQTSVEGFVIYGASPSSPGATTYAVWIADSTSALQVKSNIIYGGSGGRGSSGSAGNDGGGGGAGKPGDESVLTTVFTKAACLALSTTPGNQTAAGDAGAGSCGGSDISGGAGAGADCPNVNDAQASGTPGKSVAGGGAPGLSGAGGHDRFSNNCSQFASGGFAATGLPGGKGGNGAQGTSGIGCADADGVVATGEWSGGSASGGGDGNPGGGGGGGGAGGGADVTLDCTAAPGTDDSLGGSGGGGGGGGCAGTSGTFGGPGGGSFGVFITLTAPTSALPVVSANTIIRGYGGDGGAGGQGGAGGRGGDGGDGGLATGAFVYASGNGGRGGQGGDGGHGGGGGGGCGGVSFAIYVNNAAITPAYDSANAFSGGGSGGVGGPGGASLGAKGSAGATGLSGDTNF